MPPSVDWPQTDGNAALFLVQIALSDLPDDIWRGLGPKSGWLLFFLAPRDWGGLGVLHVRKRGTPRPYLNGACIENYLRIRWNAPRPRTEQRDGYSAFWTDCRYTTRSAIGSDTIIGWPLGSFMLVFATPSKYGPKTGIGDPWLTSGSVPSIRLRTRSSGKMPSLLRASRVRSGGCRTSAPASGPLPAASAPWQVAQWVWNRDRP